MSVDEVVPRRHHNPDSRFLFRPKATPNHQPTNAERRIAVQRWRTELPKTPPELIKRYGADNGFGWALGDVVGAQIVSIPAQVADDRAVAAQKTVMLWLSGIFAGLWVLANGLVYSFYKRDGFAKPVRAQTLS